MAGGFGRGFSKTDRPNEGRRKTSLSGTSTSEPASQPAGRLARREAGAREWEERERGREGESNRSAVHENLIDPATATPPPPAETVHGSEQEESLVPPFPAEAGRQLRFEEEEGDKKEEEERNVVERSDEDDDGDDEEVGEMRMGERKTDCD